MGQTGRRLNVRIKDHAKKYTMKDENSSLYTHTKDMDHNIDLTNVKILDIEANRGKRLFYTQTNYMNKQFEISKLSSQYTSLIKNCEFMRL